MKYITQLMAAVALGPSLAPAQTLPSALVTDTIGDAIWLLNDLDGDGTYNGAGEVAPYFEDVASPFALTNNAGLLRSDDGAVWISDVSEDVVLRLFDENFDGDALDAGEAAVWFDGTAGNPSGVELTSGRGMWRDDDGVLWVASSNTGGGGNDAIVRLEDVNGDGDANDPGEQLEYFNIAPGGAVGDSFPTAVARGSDGAIYYVETSSTGFLAKGVWRLEDLDGSGIIDQPQEATLFFEPNSGGATPFHWDLGLDDQGRFYLNDTGNDDLWRFSDVDGNGVVDPLTEAELIFSASGSSLIWECSPFTDGSLFVAEDQNPDRLLRLVDLDGDGLFTSAGETQEIYSDAVAALDFGSPKGVVPFIPADPQIGDIECSPAALNSTGQAATIAAFGSTSLAQNNVRLSVDDLPAFSFGFFITSVDAGFVANPGGSQGNLCLSGEIGRYVGPDIFQAGTDGSASLDIDTGMIPQPSGLVAAAAGDTWRFQAWYRDANPAPTSNFTSAVAITFVD